MYKIGFSVPVYMSSNNKAPLGWSPDPINAPNNSSMQYVKYVKNWWHFTTTVIEQRRNLPKTPTLLRKGGHTHR